MQSSEITIPVKDETGFFTKIQHPSGRWIEGIHAISQFKVIDLVIHVKLLGIDDWFPWHLAYDENFVQWLQYAVELNTLARQRN